jgi:hypothetical protein
MSQNIQFSVVGSLRALPGPAERSAHFTSGIPERGDCCRTLRYLKGCFQPVALCSAGSLRQDQ